MSIKSLALMHPNTCKGPFSVPTTLNLKIVYNESSLGEFSAVACLGLVASGHSGDHHFHFFCALFCILPDRQIVVLSQYIDLLLIAGDLACIAVLIV